MTNVDVFPIVAIGASAGGLNALTELIANLPMDTGIAFVIVTHMSPNQESNLSAILQRSTVIKIAELKNDTKIEPNHIYVMAPNTEICYQEGIIQTIPRQPATIPAPIDHFLSSLAQSKREHIVGVILSGEGSDGSCGISEIQEHGGITFAQDPGTTEHISMPVQAIAAGVDFVLSPKNIAIEIGLLAQHLEKFNVPQAPKNSESNKSTSNNDINSILAILAKKNGKRFFTLQKIHNHPTR